MKTLILCCVVLIPTAGLSQPLPGPYSKCSTEDVACYVESGLKCMNQCANNFGTITPNSLLYNPDITIRSNALTKVCTQNCSGLFACWAQGTCNDTASYEGINIWCTPTGVNESGRDRCYFAVPPQINLDVFNSLSVCSTETFIPSDPSCPAGCADALNDVVNVLGCCFTTLYTNSEFLASLVTTGFATQEEIIQIQLLGSVSPVLWQACSITMPVECKGAMPFGNCTQVDTRPCPAISKRFYSRCNNKQELLKYIESNLTCQDQCAESFAILSLDQDEYNCDIKARSKALKKFCTSECAGAISRWCESAFSEAIDDWCTQTGVDIPGRNYCYFAFPPQIDFNIIDQLYYYCGSAFVTDTNPCPDDCLQSVRMTVDTLGCCFAYYYYDEFFAIEFAHEYATLQQITKLRYIGWPQACNVSYPTWCENARPYDGCSIDTAPCDGINTTKCRNSHDIITAKPSDATTTYDKHSAAGTSDASTTYDKHSAAGPAVAISGCILLSIFVVPASILQ